MSPTSIRVTWDAPVVPSGVAATLYYRLYYYDMSDLTGTVGEMDVTSIERDVTLTDLCKYCEYTLRVVAYNSDGPSDSSEEITCRTLSDGSLTSLFIYLTAGQRAAILVLCFSMLVMTILLKYIVKNILLKNILFIVENVC